VSRLLQRIEAGFNLLGRRTQPRYEASGPVLVYDGGPGGPFLENATLRNISASGACIAMQKRLVPGCHVYLAGPVIRGAAIVRHAGAGCDGYIVGLEFLCTKAQSDQDSSGLPAAW